MWATRGEFIIESQASDLTGVIRSPEASGTASSHKNDGFIKAAWHKLTHQHDNLTPEESGPERVFDEKIEEEEPRKAGGSG